ncbi:hypothetical protein PHYSODRAFT_328772 [Phytophthora sojae]|uniref:Uncharacterized protein n=1 Tax=Phytophthora sojae (strain P6497) TaxID=1094619 RepID=G4Z1Z8_PHYSP|nr:hypothetical protein PHYSODRAFT_328772 [Phytophthora sojae]EGZ20689.1 hypothetical protein PHYSODRAFT_328772 [Phytophthora sojae]|eukprot:XP_009523406.1 hypothetical protein PHYSODRAFT_328772 [Phytophthora sojae]
MSASSVTLKLPKRLSDEDRSEELQHAISKCSCRDLRSFCRTLGVRIKRKKYEAYNNKAGFAKLLTKKLASRTAAKRRDETPPNKESYLHLLKLILSDVIPSPLLEKLLVEGDANVGDSVGDAACETRSKASQKKKKQQRAPKSSAIKKASRLLKEIFPPDSQAAKIVGAELVRSLEYFETICPQDDEADSDE